MSSYLRRVASSLKYYLASGNKRNRMTAFNVNNSDPIKSDINDTPFPEMSEEMEKASVSFEEEDKVIEISINYKFPTGFSRQINFNRKSDEKLETSLSRIGHSITQIINKKQKRKTAQKQTDNEPFSTAIDIKLFAGTEQIDVCSTNREAWEKCTLLQINNAYYRIDYNPPQIKSITLPKLIMVGCYVDPVIKSKNTDISKMTFKWYREAKTVTNENVHKKPKLSESAKYEFLSSGRLYLPKPEDHLCKLKLECLPSDGQRIGHEASVISPAPVVMGTSEFPFQKRHELTKLACTNNSFRIVSYNILAKMYSDSRLAREHLFAHCPKEYLDMEYRKQIFVREILGYNADIICLQEVDKKVFGYTLCPILEHNGYRGTSCMKTGEFEEEEGVTFGMEGCAVFYRESKFRLIKQHDANLTELLKRDTELWAKVENSEDLARFMEKRNTIVQICVLESTHNPAKKVLIATTHLFFHPKANNIRILQTLACLRQIHNVLQNYKDQDVSVVFCGDFNAAPINGVHTLIQEGKVKNNHADWYSGGLRQLLTDMNVESPITLTNVCDTTTYTNYVTAFSGCLDYIYIDSEKLAKIREIPRPSHEEVTEFTALPNKVFPSDHLALVADVEWT